MVFVRVLKIHINMFSKLVTKYPIVKTMGAYFCINVMADLNEQTLIKKRTRETYDRGKTARIAATCTFITSPMLFVWIRFIEKMIPGCTTLAVLKKVVADACCFAPVVISMFYISTNVLEGKSDLTAEWKQKFFTTWTTGLCYWPFVQAVNFAFIPLKYKTCVYMPTASFIWMNYLCYMKDKKMDPTEPSSNACLQKITDSLMVNPHICQCSGESTEESQNKTTETLSLMDYIKAKLCQFEETGLQDIEDWPVSASYATFIDIDRLFTPAL